MLTDWRKSLLILHESAPVSTFETAQSVIAWLFTCKCRLGQRKVRIESRDSSSQDNVEQEEVDVEQKR